MELGISMFGDLAPINNSDQRKPAGQRIKELLREIQLADEVGLDSFGLGEHHRKDYAITNPEIVLSAAATITQKIKLGSAVTVLSSADPIRIYQNFSALDLLSDGRAEVMLGRGSFIESFPLFGYELSDYDSLFEDKLSLFMTIQENEIVNWKGKFRKPLQQQPIFPRPYHKKLPVWIAVGGTPQSVQRAAQLGLPLMLAIIGGNPANFKPLVSYYKAEYIKHGHNPEQMQIGVHAHTLIGKNGRQIADDLYPYYAAQMSQIGRERGWPPYSREQYEAGRSRHGALIVGSVEETAEKIIHLCKMLELTRFVAHMDVGGPPHEMLLESISLLGTEVADIVRKELP